MRLKLNVRYRACLPSNFPTPRAIYEKYMVSGFEPLNTNFSHFWIYIIVKAFTFPRESNPNINKNRRERLLWNLCPFADLFRTTLPRIRGNRAQKDYRFTNLIENWGIVKKLRYFQNKIRIEIPQFTYENTNVSLFHVLRKGIFNR